MQVALGGWGAALSHYGGAGSLAISTLTKLVLASRVTMHRIVRAKLSSHGFFQEMQLGKVSIDLPSH